MPLPTFPMGKRRPWRSRTPCLCPHPAPASGPRSTARLYREQAGRGPRGRGCRRRAAGARPERTAGSGEAAASLPRAPPRLLSQAREAAPAPPDICIRAARLSPRSSRGPETWGVGAGAGREGAEGPRGVSSPLRARAGALGASAARPTGSPAVRLRCPVPDAWTAGPSGSRERLGTTPPSRCGRRSPAWSPALASQRQARISGESPTPRCLQASGRDRADLWGTTQQVRRCSGHTWVDSEAFPVRVGAGERPVTQETPTSPSPPSELLCGWWGRGGVTAHRATIRGEFVIGAIWNQEGENLEINV